MSFQATVTSEGRVTIPKEVRERLDIQEGESVLFQFDEDGALRLVAVPADPMERFAAVRERASGLDVDVQTLIDREREQWERLQ